MITRHNKRMIGIFDGTRRLYTKTVRRSVHLFRKLDAWGIDAKLFDETLVPVNATIRVTDKEEGLQYETTAQTMKELGAYLHFKGSIDHGTQVFLPRASWNQKVTSPHASQKG